VIQVRNCGRRSLVIDGYPVVKLLDTHRRQLAVTVKRDSSYMAIDTGPERYRLKPGRHLVSVIAWSATVTDPDPATEVRGAYLVIASGNGQPFKTFKVDADLGTTTELDVVAWSSKLAN
jgi:Domain of unknown function (DUF4232)